LDVTFVTTDLNDIGYLIQGIQQDYNILNDLHGVPTSLKILNIKFTQRRKRHL
jgi:hypothetical protein